MSYVIYHTESTRLFKENIASERAAKAQLTKAANAGKINREEYSIASDVDFHNNIEKTVTRRNLMSGEPIEVRVNTPVYLDPSCESYWSM